MRTADALLFVVDGRGSVSDEDAAVATILRRIGTPVLCVVNKLDSDRRDPGAWEFLSLGLGDPYPASALHGRGTGDLLDALIDVLPDNSRQLRDPTDTTETAGDDPAEGANESDELFSVAIVGRPNVGKSTLFNRLIGEERAIVHDLPGTTRDAVDTVVDTEHGRVRFVDTAGMRRRAKIDTDTEYYSLLRALKAVDGADVALLVIDSTVGVTHQDQRLAERVDGAGCPIVVLLNKWELLDTEAREDLARQLGQRLHFVGDSTVLRISALTGRGVHRVIEALAVAIDEYRTRVPTGEVNRVMRLAQQRQPAPAGARVLYATQGATDPPTFTLFTNKDLPRSYLRYLERALREECGLGATPIKLRVRRR